MAGNKASMLKVTQIQFKNKEIKVNLERMHKIHLKRWGKVNYNKCKEILQC